MVTIGVTQWSLDGLGVETLHAAAELGLTAIHIDAGELGGDLLLDKPSLQAAYSNAARETGVSITGIAPGYLNSYGLTNINDPSNVKRCRQLIHIAIDAAAEMNVPLVFIPSFGASEIRTQEDLLCTARVLEEACVYAADRGLSLSTENTLDANGNLRLLDAVGIPNLRVLLDTQNIVVRGIDGTAFAIELWQRLSDQVHIKDGTGGKLGNALLGAGDGKFMEMAGTLRSLGFDGTLILENDYQGENRARAARDIATVQEIFGKDRGGYLP